MDTSLLKSFAVSSRVELIREVRARLSVVLGAASAARVESSSVVTALEGAIAAAGGGGAGQQAVVDRVAYTWFNRIIALRFMDANGYTGIGVVSPEAGRPGGQAEVLAEAKQGHFDGKVVNAATAARVTSLLNGTARSTDPQGEAYGVLLAEYCRFWNQSMPFMFEREGDYTELLIPSDLLADDSVLAKAVVVLTPEVCADVEVIGWMYQFYISERKDEVFAGFKKNKKAGPAEIPAATQLFTPDWVVRYLVENSLGRLWMLNRPASNLVDRMEYYISPGDDENDFLKIGSPEELKIMDPACGSGHMLTYAFDLLCGIYEEEGFAPAEIPSLILSNNLFGTEIDPRAGSLAAFALTMKARAKQRTFFTNTVKPHICVLEPISFTPEELDALVTPGGNRADEEEFWQQFEHADTFGSLILSKEYLIRVLKTHLLLNPPADMLATELHERSQRVLGQAEYLSKRFHVVVANPPYMGSKNMAVRLREFASREYSVSKADLMTMFMERARTLVLVGGVWAMINLPTWMYLSSFIALRKLLLRDSTIISLVQFGRGIFGSDFGSVAFVMSERPPSASTRGVYRRLFNRGVEVRSNETIRQLFLDPSFNKFDVRQGDLELLPGSPIAFGLDGSLLQLFGKRKLSDAVRISAGISTGDNSRFIRLWHEVSADRVHVSETDTAPWKLHNKGGAYRKWYGNIEHVLKYSPESVREMEKLLGFRHDGKEVYLRAHVSWSEVTSGRPSFRYYPSGMTFGSGSKSIFDDNQLLILLGYLNSQFIEKILAVLSPGIRLDVGQIAGLPMPDLGKDGSAVEQLVRRAIALGRSEWDANESSFDFKRLHVLDSPGVPLEVAQLEQARRRQIQLEELDVIERDVDRIFVEALSVEADRGHLGNEIVAPIDESAKPDAETDLCTDHRSPDDDVLGLESSRASVIELVSYAVGCMFGRYSLDLPGLVLASQGETLRDYLGRVPAASFLPDADNVIPIIDGEWFEDDIVARFRLFLRVAFGGEQFEDNLRFVEDVLGKDIRKYFVADFYKDHLQRYKKRPIYWLFSSPKGSFNALIYMHRYTSSTVSTVLNDYLREYRHKLDSERENQERMSGSAKSPRDKARADKEVDRIRKVQLELEAYEHDVLYPLATQQITIDLDDGVKVNYPKFGSALKKIPGLEATDE